jgi:hypothetical protein
MNNQTADDRAALRDAIRRAVCEAEGFGYAWGTDMLEPDEYGEVADTVLAVLPAPADQAAEIERLRAENERMRHELEVMYGGAFDSLKPATVGQAAVLRGAADWLDADMERFFAEWPDEPRNSPYALGRKDAAGELRRMADEAQPEPAAVRDAREALYIAATGTGRMPESDAARHLATLLNAAVEAEPAQPQTGEAAGEER